MPALSISAKMPPKEGIASCSVIFARDAFNSNILDSDLLEHCFRWFSKISLKCRRLQSCFISLHLSKTSYLGGKAVSGSPVLTFTSQDADIQIIKILLLLCFKESKNVFFFTSTSNISSHQCTVCPRRCIEGAALRTSCCQFPAFSVVVTSI